MTINITLKFVNMFNLSFVLKNKFCKKFQNGGSKKSTFSRHLGYFGKLLIFNFNLQFFFEILSNFEFLFKRLTSKQKKNKIS
jgi:hypothetical protein